MIEVESPFDFYYNFKEIDTSLLETLGSDSPFNDYRGYPFIITPFSFDTNLGTQKMEEEENNNVTIPKTTTMGINLNNSTGNSGVSQIKILSSNPTSVSQQTSDNPPALQSINSSNNSMNINSRAPPPSIQSSVSMVNLNSSNNGVSTQNNASVLKNSSSSNNLNPTPTPTPTASSGDGKKKKKRKIINFPKKKKKTKGPGYPGAKFEDSILDMTLRDDFSKYLRKKENEYDLKFYISIKKFEEETDEVHSRAMNICFEFLGIGGGELQVSVEGNIVNEIAQIIRSKQSSKEMFERAKLAIEAKLRQNFSDFNR